MDNLFHYLKAGYYDESKVRNCHNLADLHLYIAKIFPKDALTSTDMAYYAGRLQALFGYALSLRQPIAENEFNPDETAQAEALERFISENFATVWRNAVYLHNLGK